MPENYYVVGSEWEDRQNDIWVVLPDDLMHCEVGNTTAPIDTVEYDYGPLKLYREVACYDCETSGYNCSAHRDYFVNFDVRPAGQAIDQAVASVLSFEAKTKEFVTSPISKEAADLYNSYSPVETLQVDGYTTKDSGQREVYSTGMQRDTSTDKARWDLLLPVGIPYRSQMLTRFAELMMRGAEKYTERNWELANTDEELERFKQSALRHLMQWFSGETDEDHASAVFFNVLAHESTKWKMSNATEKD